VIEAMVASTESSSKGSASARAAIAGAEPGGRWPRIVALGSTANTQRPAGSYEPAPAPTLITVRASPRAASIRAAILGSGRRWRA
jgi:hypothetical protein